MDTSPPLATAPPVAPQKSGGGKKWLAFGCGGCLVLIILGALGMGAVMYFGLGALKSTDVYKTALQRAQDSPEVQAALGTPIEAGFMLGGSMKNENGHGSADINFPISGPKGEGTVFATATMDPGGAWQYSKLQVHVKNGGQVIDLGGGAP
jgi:hypothetical protein